MMHKTKTSGKELVAAAREKLAEIREKTNTGKWGFGYIAEAWVDGKWRTIPGGADAWKAMFPDREFDEGWVERVDSVRFRQRDPERIPFVSAPADNLIGVENRADDAVNEHAKVWTKPSVCTEDAIAILRRLSGRVDDAKLQAAIEAAEALAENPDA